MRIRWTGFWLVAMLAGSMGCGGGGLGDCPPNSDVTQTQGRQILMDNCVTCHSSQLTGAARSGAPADYNFDDIAFVREEAAELYSEAESGAMPPTGGLNDSQVESLRVYLACGAQ
jgi:mono/diheme cytochrome c family protein